MTEVGGLAGASSTGGGVDLARIAAGVREMLAGVGEDPDRDGLRQTPDRVARMYAEIFSGLQEDPGEHLAVTFEADHDELVLVRDIQVYSVCEHHLLPWAGKAHVAYIPGASRRVTGLSKLVRLVDGYAKRPQVQERLTSQVADTLVRGPGTKRRAGGGGGGAPLYVHARRSETGCDDRDIGGAGAFPHQFGGAGRGARFGPPARGALSGPAPLWSTASPARRWRPLGPRTGVGTYNYHQGAPGCRWCRPPALLARRPDHGLRAGRYSEVSR